MMPIKKILISLVCVIPGWFFVAKPVYAADTTPPSTVSTISLASANGKNGWYITPVTFTLDATDLESGVAEINYQVDSGTWQKVSFSDTLNLAPNPSLEDPDVGSPINTRYWTKTSPGGSATYSRDFSNFAPGYGIVSIKIFSNASGWHTISHPDNFSVAAPYSNMNASAWFKTEGVGEAYFKIFAVSQDQLGNRTNTEIARSASLAGTNDWTKLSVNFNVNVSSAIGVYMEAGTDGPETTWVDAVSISESISATSTTVSVGADGTHTLSFYSVDKAGNIETTSTVNFKIDQTAPGIWNNSGAIRGLFGSDHELYVYTNVEDATSGLSVFTDRYQYLTKVFSTFGYFSNLLSCNSTWNVSGWFLLISPPFSPGVKSAYLITPKTDFCDNDWKVCKTVRFYAEDLAGNMAVKEYCINGPWIKVSGEGVVGSLAGINMVAEALDDNTDGLIEVGNTNVSFFTSSRDFVVKNQVFDTNFDYDTYRNSAQNPATLGGTLPTSSGIYLVDGNFTVGNSQVPSNYNNRVFNAVVFVNGDLTIEKDIEINVGSALLFIVNGDVRIMKSVSKAQFGVIADGTLFTAYDIEEGDAAPTLYLKGIYSANVIRLQRTLQGTGNEKNPSEDFTYEPKYITKLADYIGKNAVQWLTEEENY